MVNRKEITAFYLDKLREHTTSAERMGWKSKEAQQVRFRQLIKIIDPHVPFSINDLGCGSGDLINVLNEQFDSSFTYHGYDGLPEMLTIAKQQFQETSSIKFSKITGYHQLSESDYSVASGIFNYRKGVIDREWQEYILDTLLAMSRCSRKGFSFNALTKYSDPEKMLPELFYSDPLLLFDFCKRNFSKNVALLPRLWHL
ncbi:MAG: class I SAM-dependent methyltransferase [Bacteroidota bacterium]